MSAHAMFEQLAVAGIDFRLSPREEADLGVHLATCSACRAFTQAYRADAAVLRTIAFASSPARVRAAVIDASVRPAHRRPAWQLLAVAALLTILLAGLALTAGALLQRLTDDSVFPVEVPGWMGTDDWRFGGIVALDDEWLVGITGIHGTRLQTYDRALGWRSEGSDGLMEFVLLSDLGRLSGSDLLAVGVVQREKGVVLLRRQGVWSRSDALDALHIWDSAVSDDRIWLVASPAFAPDGGGLTVAMGSAEGDFSTVSIDAPFGVDRAQIAAANGRLALAGCSADGEACQPAILTGSDDGTGWTSARIPAAVGLGDQSNPQLLAISDSFLALVPSRAGGAEIWQSGDGREWDVAATFAPGQRPELLVADGSRPLAIGLADGRLAIWVPDEAQAWQEQRTAIVIDKTLAAGAQGDRVFVIGTNGGAIQGWDVEVEGR